MKHLFKPRISGLLMTFLLIAGGTQTALAAGTQSGLNIDNTATVNYLVGGFIQTPVLSSPDGLTPTGVVTRFVVDNKVDLTVANLDGGGITVAPGSTNQVLTFSVTNTGNTIQSYSFSVVNGPLNDIPMGSVEIWMDTNGDGLFDGGDTQYNVAGDAGDLDPNGGTDSMTVFIVADTPLLPFAIDGDVDDYNLLATTLDAGTAAVTLEDASDTALGVEVVFADLVAGTAAGDVAEDGRDSDSGSYTVASATLVVTKAAPLVNDGFGGDFAIPGAIVTYTITVANTGGTAATSVVITDGIPANTTYVAASITLNGTPQSDGSPGVPVDTSDYNVTTASAVTVGIASIAAGITDTITFQVTID